MRNESKISYGMYSLIETLYWATLKCDETRQWGLSPILTAKGDKQQKSYKVVLSPASGKEYGCNNHPFFQKPNLLWPLRYMRFSGKETLQHLITVKHRDRWKWGSCLYKPSLQQEWFRCRISLTHDPWNQHPEGSNMRWTGGSDGGAAFCCWRKST